MIIYHTESGIFIENSSKHYLIKNQNWDEFINDDQLFAKCQSACNEQNSIQSKLPPASLGDLLKPIGRQEIWAAGVTYFNSKMARQEESKLSGGADFYAKVYTAERPEIFFKSTSHRAVGHRQKIAIRSDSSWNVPEPELTLCISSSGTIVGYTIGNDVSSRSIEGENPLYLPQAKTYDRSAAIGPGILVTKEPLPPDTSIQLMITRGDLVAFQGETRVNQIVRKLEDLVQFLYHSTSFPHGCFLMTGTGIVPPNDFSLQSGDQVDITIEHIGTLTNIVE